MSGQNKIALVDQLQCMALKRYVLATHWSAGLVLFFI